MAPDLVVFNSSFVEIFCRVIHELCKTSQSSSSKHLIHSQYEVHVIITMLYRV